MYGCGGHFGHAIWTIHIYFISAFPRRLHIKFGFDWPSGFREKIFEKCCHIHVYSPGAGEDNLLGSNIFSLTHM